PPAAPPPPARLMPPPRGRTHDEQASGTIPRRANTKPNLAVADARRTSNGRAIVIPTPTAAPLIAPIRGLVHEKKRRATTPPSSRCRPSGSFTTPGAARPAPPQSNL